MTMKHKILKKKSHSRKIKCFMSLTRKTISEWSLGGGSEFQWVKPNDR